MGEEKVKKPAVKEYTENDKSVTRETGQREEECRCKEVSKKSLPQLVKLMLSDLALWKKRNTK